MDQAPSATVFQAAVPHNGERAPGALPPTRCWPLANNAGGVVIFNLTTDQRAFEARVWSSNVFRIGDGILGLSETCATDDVQLCVQNLKGAHGTSPTCTSTAGPAPVGTPDIQLLLKVDARNPDMPKPELFKVAKDGTTTPIAPYTPILPMADMKRPKTRTYWLSFDRWNQCIKYGRGYHMEQTTEKTWNMSNRETGGPLTKEEAAELFGPMVKLVSFKVTECAGPNPPGPSGGNSGAGMDVGYAAALVEFDPLPLVRNPPALVLDSSKVSLEAMTAQEYTFSADLPAACKVLYQNIAGVELDAKLADAIKYSIGTEGMVLYKKLWEKKYDGAEWTEADRGKLIDNGKGEFPYLRVTLGRELGNGPGIPYVLEIWPGRIGLSPVHNHGNVCAVIKVLHGSLRVHVYNKLELKADDNTDPSRGSELPAGATPSPLFTQPLKQGDVTWMSPHWYQSHCLDNTHGPDGSGPLQLGNYCATIQCYKYDDQDTVRWTGFDYFDVDTATGKEVIHLFKPDTDFTYEYMKKAVLEEYRLAHGNNNPSAST